MDYSLLWLSATCVNKATTGENRLPTKLPPLRAGNINLFVNAIVLTWHHPRLLHYKS